MKSIILLFNLFIVVNLYSQNSFEYQGIKVYFPDNNQKVFKEGEQVLFYSVCENTNSVESNIFMLFWDYLIDLSTNDTVKRQSYSTHTNYSFNHRTIPVFHHYQPGELYVNDSRMLLRTYAHQFYPYLKTYLPPRLYYFKPGKYRAYFKVDIQPIGLMRELIYDFEVVPFEGNEKNEFESFIKSIEWSLSAEEYDMNAPESLHSFIKNNPNSIYTKQAYMYLIHDFSWMQRSAKEKDHIASVKYKYDVLSENIYKIPNPYIRYQYAQKLAQQIMSLKKGGIVTDEVEYLNKELKKLKNDAVSSSVLIIECKQRGMDVSKLKNYALSTE